MAGRKSATPSYQHHVMSDGVMCDLGPQRTDDQKRRYQQLPRSLQSMLWPVMKYIDAIPVGSSIKVLEVGQSQGKISTNPSLGLTVSQFLPNSNVDTDLETDIGFQLLLQLVKQIDPAGTMWIAPSRRLIYTTCAEARHARDIEPHPNKVIIRVAAASLVAFVNGVNVVYEQAPRDTRLWNMMMMKDRMHT